MGLSPLFFLEPEQENAQRWLLSAGVRREDFSRAFSIQVIISGEVGANLVGNERRSRLVPSYEIFVEVPGRGPARARAHRFGCPFVEGMRVRPNESGRFNVAAN